MKIGLVGYQGAGKTTLFEWLTGVAADLASAHTGQSAMAAVPEPRVQSLSRTHEGNATRLGLIREAGCLVLVVEAFGGRNPLTDLTSFREDLLLADMEIVSGRVGRLRESVKKPRPNRDQELAELSALERVLSALESGTPLTADKMSEEDLRATRSFRLMWEKPMLVIVNVADDEADSARFDRPAAGDEPRMMAVRVGLERELDRMQPDDRAEFERELGLSGSRRDEVLKAILDASGQMLYFTAGEKEVRTWMLRQGGTALEAADNIHSDLARGFIRAETMQVEDLVRLGSEREVKAAHLVRQEPKDYVVRDGDILNIKFSV
jgi:hypothetical protein